MLAATTILPELTLWEAGVLACILATADTSLASLVVQSHRVPTFIREALSAESGLSDGLIVPFLMLFISLMQASAQGPARSFVGSVVQQIGFAVPLGTAIGLAGGWFLAVARRRGWASLPFQQLATVSLAPLCLVVAERVGTSPFIAAFVAGLALQIGLRGGSAGVVEFSENEGRLLNMVVFFFFGTAAGSSLARMGPAPVVYAVLSLTLVRMVPVAISLIGTRLSPPSVLFMGWFGPRGLASIVLGLVAVQQQAPAARTSLIGLALTATVLLSIVAHGLSASPGVNFYSRQVAQLDPDAPELRETVEAPAM
jgi:NhaP-type Na+/H+ or K+/H+ antiporter